MAIDQGDGRLGPRLDRRIHRKQLAQPIGVGLVVGQRLPLLEVDADAERLVAGAGDQQDVDAVVGLDVGDGLMQQAHHAAVDGVQRLRPVQRQDGDAVVALVEQDFFGHRGPQLSRRMIMAVVTPPPPQIEATPNSLFRRRRMLSSVTRMRAPEIPVG